MIRFIFLFLLFGFPSLSQASDDWSDKFQQAVTSYQQGEFDKARILLLETVELAKTPDQIASTASNLSHIERHFKNYPLAASLAKKAAEAMYKAYGPYHHDTMVDYVNLGKIYTEMDRVQEGEKILFNVLSIAKKTNQKISLPAGHALNSLGDLYVNKKESKKALVFYTEAKNVFKKLDANRFKSLIEDIEKNIIINEKK